MKTGAGIAGLAMLRNQPQNYEGNFTEQMIEVIDKLQREANREPTPAIAVNLASSYKWCANEVGKGKYL